MLMQSRVLADVPAADLTRARAFYADKLGLTPVQELGPSLIRTTEGGTSFMVYETAYAGQVGHTIAQWHVDDRERGAAALARRSERFT